MNTSVDSKDPGESAGESTADVSPELAAALAEIAELKDKFLRAKAETDNVRRRADNDVASARKYAIESFAAEILAVRDSLDLARSVELDRGSDEAVQKMYEGIDLTLKVMDGVLQKFGIALVDPHGEKFDPARHQAISMVASGEIAANHVVSVVQKGYVLKDRLLRPAMVVVSRGPESPATPENS